MKTVLTIFISISLSANLFSQTLEQNIREIRTQFNRVNSQKDFEKVYFENEEFTDQVPSEGCGLEGYYKDGNLYKIVESDAVSTAIYTTEFYLKNNQLIFVYRKESEFTKLPGSGEVVDTETIYEERVYYKNGEIIRHLEKGMSVLDKPLDYQELFKEYKKYINTKVKYEKQYNLLQGTWINSDDLDDWFEITGIKATHYNQADYLKTSRIWFDGRYLWFHNTNTGEDTKYEVLELTNKKLEMQNKLSGEVLIYEKNTD